MKTVVLFVTLLASSFFAFADSFRYLSPNETLADGDIISIVSLAPDSSGQCLAGGAHGDDAAAVTLTVPAPGRQSATRWRVSASAPGVYALQCLGISDGPMWLNGGTLSGRVALALSPNGVSGASWGVYREGTGVNFKCLGKAEGVRWLTTAGTGRVALAAEPEGLPALWQVQLWKKSPTAGTAAQSESKQ